MQKITVNASESYDVIISPGLLDESGGYIKNTAGGTAAALISDDIVSAIYGPAVEKSLSDAGYRVVKYIFRNGESSKNAATYIGILNFLAENRLTRSDVIVALGGGVTGDLAGFAAATYLRGIRYVQLPTTLLAAVDSSVGGKTAIDLDSGKNLAGAFYQPCLVLCDISVFSTLSEKIFADGCAEVIKYGIICDRDFFDKLHYPAKDRLEEIISRCVAIKRDIVCADERENGVRQLLNFGHTIGHAVEKCSGYGISHGSAVSIGMAVMARACAAMNICSGDCRDRIIEMIERYGLPTVTRFSPDDLFNAAMSDKKRNADTINIVVPEKIGQCTIMKIKTEKLREFICLCTECGV